MHMPKLGSLWWLACKMHSVKRWEGVHCEHCAVSVHFVCFLFSAVRTGFQHLYCNMPIVNVVVKLCVKYANFVKLCVNYANFVKLCVNYANFVKLCVNYANFVKLCVKLHCRFQCSVSLCPGDRWRSWSCQTHILHQLVILDHPDIL